MENGKIQRPQILRAFLELHQSEYRQDHHDSENNSQHPAKQFVSNQVRLALFLLACNLGNFLRRLVLPREIKHWSLRTLLTKLIKIGAKVVRHSRYVTFQMAEVAVSRKIFAEILLRIDRLRPCPA